MTGDHTFLSTDQGLLLPGLDGANPLGFLAALGLLRTLGHAQQHARVQMRWVPSGGTWVPAVHIDMEKRLDRDTLLKYLQNILVNDIDKHPARLLDDLAAKDGAPRREFFTVRADEADADTRTPVDWLAALASDFASVDAINQLQTTRRDYYYGNLTSVIKGTMVDHLSRSLFSPWDYADALDNQSLHLDPTEDRRHAHQWNKPAGDPDRKKSGGMLGANRLAIEALPFFTSFPEAGTLHTVGFTGNRSTNTRWTWPIWGVPVSLSTVASLLALKELQATAIDPETRRAIHARGVVAVFRSDHILVQKTPNFTPARRIA